MYTKQQIKIAFFKLSEDAQTIYGNLGKKEYARQEQLYRKELSGRINRYNKSGRLHRWAKKQEHGSDKKLMSKKKWTPEDLMSASGLG